MEFLDSVWQIVFMALVAGTLIGVMAYRLFAPSVKQVGKIKTELDASREELTSYKASVNQHFDKTSELVNDLTQNYVKVYQHLAEGAQILGDSKTFTNLLEQHQGRVSIAVDGETNVPDQVTDDTIVDAAVTPTVPLETVDEHAAPFTNLTADEAGPVSPEDGIAESETPQPASKLDGSAENMEPVLNVGALDETTDNSDSEIRPDASSSIPESDDKIEIRTTTH